MKKYQFILALLVTSFLVSCEKDIDIELKGAEQKIVVEGAIEQGVPPYVILTKTVGYFDRTDLISYQNSFVRGAIITVSDGVNTIQLDEIIVDGFPVYTTSNPLIFGQIGSTYNLKINAAGKILTSSTSIPAPIPMDRYWYKDQPGYSNFGYLWFNLNDPAPLGNAYRMFTWRKNKDERFLPVDGSVFDDQLINGLDFDAFVWRGSEPNSEAKEDNNEYAPYYQQGDTIYIKFCTMDLPHYNFWETFETSTFNEGNPFAAPTTIRSNIEGGGIGVWGGYGVSYDTLIATDI